MAKRCWGITKQFKRCTNERLVIPVCNKHVWQFIQLLVFIMTLGAIMVTIKLYHMYESHLQVMQEEEDTPNDFDKTNKSSDSKSTENKYESWEE